MGALARHASTLLNTHASMAEATPSATPLSRSGSVPALAFGICMERPLGSPVAGPGARMHDSYAPSLVCTTLAPLAKAGQNEVSGHAHARIGGAADHHVTDWAASCRCVSSASSSRTASVAGSGLAGSASRRSRGTSLSAASSVLLRREVSRAVHDEVSRVLSA